jgi:hypothetical protein
MDNQPYEISKRFTDFWRDWFVVQDIPDRDGNLQKIYYQFFNLNQIFKKVFASLFESVYFNAHFKKKDPKTGEILGPDIRRIPMIWTTKNKIAQWMQTRSVGDQGESFTVPIVGIVPTSIEYDSERQRPEILKMEDTEYLNILRKFSAGEVFRSYIPKPFIRGYEVNILTNEEIVQDQILEQLLPQLCPQVAFDINIPLYKKYTCRIKYDGANLENSYETTKDNERVILMSLKFSQNMILFPPIKDESTIKQIHNRLKILVEKNPEDWRTLEDVY